MSGQYDDIISLPHYVPTTRPQMPRENRAAQFSPFAAVVGYDSAVREAARLTDGRIELGESTIADLDIKLTMLAEMQGEHPEITVTYFRPDEKKDGGAYITVTDELKKIDDYERTIVFVNGAAIGIADVLEIECDLFGKLTYE